MRTSNPVFGNRFERYIRQPYETSGETMTVEGTVLKTAILLMLALITSGIVWYLFYVANEVALVLLLLMVGLIGGLVVALVTVFVPRWAAVTSPAYALLEGLVLGGISAVFDLIYPGIVLQAVALTFGVFVLVLLAYRARILQATPRFTKGVLAATGAIMILYFVGILLSFFGVPVVYFHDTGAIGIGFSLFVVSIAALNLVLDFGFIERGAAEGAPKNMEWYGAFGLMVTLVWLYLEVLRLLSLLRQ
jgi:uncharacterized YccA/Bax inhibitor family protein